MRIIIVDDEELARSLIREYCARHADAEIVAECANGFEAVKAVTDLKPDLVFLDVQMPKLTGFEVLELLDPVPAVIFVTAYDTYALKAFEVHAVDYILKPFSQERFNEALARARERMHATRPEAFSSLVSAHRAASAPLERILIRDGSRVHVIAVTAIDYMEAQDDYVAIHAGGKRHLKQIRLAELEETLDPVRFVRVHRSFILNIERLARLETYGKDSRVAILKDGTRILVSARGYERLKTLL
jgi:two-component system, LytTR family, response regulator